MHRHILRRVAFATRLSWWKRGCIALAHYRAEIAAEEVTAQAVTLVAKAAEIERHLRPLR